MGRVLGLTELGNKAELDQLGLKFWLNFSLEDFPGWWGGGGEKLVMKVKLSFSWGLGLAELGNIKHFITIDVYLCLVNNSLIFLAVAKIHLQKKILFICLY